MGNVLNRMALTHRLQSNRRITGTLWTFLNQLVIPAQARVDDEAIMEKKMTKTVASITNWQRINLIQPIIGSRNQMSDQLLF